MSDILTALDKETVHDWRPSYNRASIAVDEARQKRDAAWQNRDAVIESRGTYQDDDEWRKAFDAASLEAYAASDAYLQAWDVWNNSYPVTMVGVEVLPCLASSLAHDSKVTQEL